jgi:hypothetical protein
VRGAGCYYTALAPGSIPVIFLLHPQSAFGSHLTALNLRAEQRIYLATCSYAHTFISVWNILSYDKRISFMGLEIEGGNIWMLLFQSLAISDGGEANPRSSFVGLRKEEGTVQVLLFQSLAFFEQWTH